MAVLSHFPGLKVEIIVDGKPLQEYSGKDDIPWGSVSTKWIEARTDDAFRVRVTYSEPPTTSHAVALLIFCDGLEVAKTVRSGAELYKASVHTYSGVPVKRGTKSGVQRFYFKALGTTECDSMLDTQLTETVENVGTITIAFQFAEGVRKLANKTSGAKRLGTITRVPEKAMKGEEKSHAVGLGPVEKALSPTKFMKWKNVGTPFARFHFKYRSREVLSAMGIMPVDNTPEPASGRESTSQPYLSRESTLQASTDTFDTSVLLDELHKGENYRKRKAKDVPIKQEPDAAPQRKSARFWLTDNKDRELGTIEQKVNIVPRETTYGRLLKEADDEERAALATGAEKPTKKRRH